MKHWPVLLYLIVVLSVGTWAAAQIPGGGGGSGGGGGGNVSGSGTAGQCATWVGPNSIGATGSACGSGGSSGNITSGVVGDVPFYTGPTTLGDTGAVWPPRLDQLSAPAQGDYDAGGFFTILHNGTYQQIGATVVYGGANEALQGLSVPRNVNQTACISENLGSATVVATPTSDAGGKYITISPALSGIPDYSVAITDSTSGQISAVIQPTASSTAANSTTKLYFASTTGISANDQIVTGTAMICNTPTGIQPGDSLIVGGALDQTTETFTIPANWAAAPFTPGSSNGREVGIWSFPNSSAALASYTFSWTTPANGSFIDTRVSSINQSAPFENTTGFISGSGTSAGLGGVLNNATTDLFESFVVQATGATLTLPTAPTQGKGIIEDVLYQSPVAAPSVACDNVDQNAFGYVPPYNNVLVTDPQWGATYQRMIRTGPGGNVDHNFYYSRNSWNSNHTLMLGLQTPPSANGTGNPWIMALYDQNGCFLKPMFNATGAQPVFNWRVNWSKTDPNVFYTAGNGTAGTWPGLGNLNVNHLYAIHPCATGITGSPDSACTGTATLAVQDIFQFNSSLTTGSNFVSTNEPTGPSIDEVGTRIGIVTRPSSGSSGSYYWSSLALTNSTTITPGSLRTYNITAGIPAGYCHSSGEVEKDRYIGNGDLVQVAVYRGSGTPSCSVAAFDAGMQVIDDSTGAQADFLAQDINAPWFTGGGHETWSPHIASAGGGGYFCYAHGDGDANFSLSSCTAAGNVATCTASGGYNFPAWPIGTTVIGRSISPSGYNVTGATTSAGGSSTISYQLTTTPGAGTGGTLFDGNQWELHCSPLDGSSDITAFEAVNQQSGRTVHLFWPWGSPPNGGTTQNFFWAGWAYNGVTQYPTQTVNGCTYNGGTNTATCAMATALPSDWILPNAPQGSLGASTVYITGNADPGFNGAYPISSAVATPGIISYHPLPSATPSAVGTALGGQAYVGSTDEITKCYVKDPTFGTGCFPTARTYSASITSDFYYEPLPNGSQEGDLVEFDSAPGNAPVNSFGKVADAKTLLPGTTPPLNATLFYTYASISPAGLFQSTNSGTWSGATVAVQALPGVAAVTTYNSITGGLSGQGNQIQSVGPPGAIGDVESEGNAIGAVVPTTLVNGCKGDVTLSSGTGTFTNACVTTASACWSVDLTTPSNGCTVSAPTAGSVTITGTGTDVCRTVCQ